MSGLRAASASAQRLASPRVSTPLTSATRSQRGTITAFRAEARRLADPPGHGAAPTRNSPGEPDLADRDHAWAGRQSHRRRRDREREGHVDARLVRRAVRPRSRRRRRARWCRRRSAPRAPRAAARVAGRTPGRRRGGSTAAWATSAWISTRNDLEPSLVTVKTTPGTSRSGPAQRHRGVGDLAQARRPPSRTARPRRSRRNGASGHARCAAIRGDRPRCA